MKRVMTCVFGSLLLCACKGQGGSSAPPPGVTPGATFELTAQQLDEDIRRARNGDLPSVRALVNYYTWVSDEPESAIPWLEKAVDLGDVDLTIELARRISSGRSRADCDRAWSLLEATRHRIGLDARQLREISELSLSIKQDKLQCARWQAPSRID